MENEYKLMKESMLELDIREFGNTRLFNDYSFYDGTEIVRAFLKPIYSYSQKEIKIEIKIRKWDNTDIQLMAVVPYRVMTFCDTSYIEKSSPFLIKIKVMEDRTLRFVIGGVYSKKLFMPPFESMFLPSQFLGMTYLSKRKTTNSDKAYPYEKELFYAHLYWGKREREQKKYFKTMESFGKIIPDYRNALIRRETSKLDFTLKSSVA